jgi:hypothetical protein
MAGWRVGCSVSPDGHLEEPAEGGVDPEMVLVAQHRHRDRAGAARLRLLCACRAPPPTLDRPLAVTVHLRPLRLRPRLRHAAALGRDGEVRRLGRVENRAEVVRRLVERLRQGGQELRLCYEAGPCGTACNGNSPISAATAWWCRRPRFRGARAIGSRPTP